MVLVIGIGAGLAIGLHHSGSSGFTGVQLQNPDGTVKPMQPNGTIKVTTRPSMATPESGLLSTRLAKSGSMGLSPLPSTERSRTLPVRLAGPAWVRSYPTSAEALVLRVASLGPGQLSPPNDPNPDELQHPLTGHLEVPFSPGHQPARPASVC